MKATTHTQAEVEIAYEMFVDKIQTMVNKHFEEHYSNLQAPTIETAPGRKYWKIIKTDKYNGTPCGSASVFGFVRIDDGAIFKAASWAAPFIKGPSAIRGYVTDYSNGMDSVTPYGVIYAQ